MGEATPAPKMVLIVDDEEPIAEALAFLIEDAGYAVKIALHGRAAFATILQHAPDLILTDFMMPQMTGAELIIAVRAAGFVHLPIVLLSAAEKDELRDLGADAIVSKPFEITEIDAILQHFLAS